MAMTVFIRFRAHVGTTYKRALTKKIPVRDHVVSACPAHNSALGEAARYHRIIVRQGETDAQTTRL
jgi:hypothetical protein